MKSAATQSDSSYVSSISMEAPAPWLPSKVKASRRSCRYSGVPLVAACFILGTLALSHKDNNSIRSSENSKRIMFDSFLSTIG